MNFDELDAIIEANTDASVCPICGTPYRKYHRRQRTCGTDECKNKWRSIYYKARKMRMREEDIDAFRKQHAEAQRRCRQKKKRTASLDESYQALEEYWGKKHNDNIVGLDYGKRQAEKTLASVPKIDVEGFLKEIR